MYRGGNKGLFVLLSRTQAGPGRTVKQGQEEISRNHVQTFISPSVHVSTPNTNCGYWRISPKKEQLLPPDNTLSYTHMYYNESVKHIIN